MSIGAGRLYKENIDDNKKSIIENIKMQVSEIRSNKDSRYEHNNFISILGGRGYGKTSLALTVLEDIKKEEKGDIILDLIDPARFNVEKNVLGWIIAMIGNEIEKLEREKNNYTFCNGSNRMYEELKNIFDQFKINYIRSRSIYTRKGAAVVDGSYGLTKVMEEALFADVKLRKNFHELIDKFMDCVQLYNVERNKKIKEKNEGPLMFITFDDLDISPQYSSDIINTMLGYLAHKSIVVIILGEYKTFKESKIIDLWNENEIPKDFRADDILTENTIINNIARRSDHILEKSMPSYLRHKISPLNLEDRLNFTPYGRKKDDSVQSLRNLLSRVKIGNALFNKYLSNYELSSDLIRWIVSEYKKLRENTKNHSRRNSFEDRIDDLDDKLDNQEQNRVKLEEDFPYAHILGKTPRNIMNLYNYLLASDIFDNMEIILPDNILSYKEKRKIYKQNYSNLEAIYRLLNETNLEIHENNSIFKFKDVFCLDYELNRFKFNFSNIKINAVTDVEYEDYNVSSENLRITYTDSVGGKYNLNDSQSAFLQFFYDICLKFLSSDNYRIEGNMDLSDIWIYRKEKYGIDIRMINFQYFYEFYMFQKYYHLSVPIIYGDGNTQKEVNRRLRESLVKILGHTYSRFGVGYLNILENTYGNDKSYIKLESIKNSYKVSNIIDFIKYFDKSSDELEDFLDEYKKENLRTNIFIEYVKLIFNNDKYEKRLETLEKMNKENLSIISDLDIASKMQNMIANGSKWQEVRKELILVLRICTISIVGIEINNRKDSNKVERLTKFKSILRNKENSILDSEFKNEVKKMIDICIRLIDTNLENIKLAINKEEDKKESNLSENLQDDINKSLEMFFSYTKSKKSKSTKFDEVMSFLDKIKLAAESTKKYYSELLFLRDEFDEMKMTKDIKVEIYEKKILPEIFNMMDWYIANKVKKIFDGETRLGKLTFSVSRLADLFNEITGPTRSYELGKQIPRCAFIHDVGYKGKPLDLQKIKMDFGIEDSINE